VALDGGFEFSTLIPVILLHVQDEYNVQEYLERQENTNLVSETRKEFSEQNFTS
jgi:hypothetical protein